MAPREGTARALAGNALKGDSKPAEERKEKKTRPSTSFYLDPNLVNRCRDAVVQLAGPPAFLTLTGLAVQALENELARLSKEYNKGKPFPPRGDRKVKAGRPVE